MSSLRTKWHIIIIIILRSSPCDSVSYAEFVYFHFRIFNCRPMFASTVHDKNPQNVTCKYCITFTRTEHLKKTCEISAKIRRWIFHCYVLKKKPGEISRSSPWIRFDPTNKVQVRSKGQWSPGWVRLQLKTLDLVPTAQHILTIYVWPSSMTCLSSSCRTMSSKLILGGNDLVPSNVSSWSRSFCIRELRSPSQKTQSNRDVTSSTNN